MRAAHPRLASIVLILALALAGCSGESSESLLQQAQASLKTGDTKTALIQLKSAVQADTENGAARFELAQLQLNLGDFASAEKELVRAKQLGLPTEHVYPLLARALNGQNAFTRVIDEIPRPAAGSTGEATLLVAIAQAELSTRDVDAARASLARASTIAPQDADVLLGLAKLALADSDVPKSLQILDDSLKLNPRHPDSWFLKANLLLATGQAAEAVRAFRTVIDIDSRRSAARLALANIALAENRPEEARSEASAVLKIIPNHPEAGYILAVLDQRDNKFEAARDRLANVLKAAPDYAPALLLAGTAEYALGNLQMAETHLNKALKANPRHPIVLRILAATKLRQGQADEATRLLARIPAEAQDAAFHIIAGETALAQKDFSKSSKHFEQAAKLNPDNADIRTQLGLARLAQGDTRAIADLQAASNLDGDNDRADSLIILNQLQKKQFDDALASIARLEKKTQPSPLSWNYRGAAQLGKKEIGKARSSFEQALKLNPGFFPAAANLAQLDLQDNQEELARLRFEGVLKANPKNINAMMALAELALSKKDTKNHVAWLDKAMKTDDKALTPRIAMTRYLLGTDDKAKALNLASETYNMQPDNPVTLDLLGSAQLASGEITNALSTYRKLIDRQPGQIGPLIKLATAQIANKDLAGARSNLNSALRIQPKAILAQELLMGLEIQDKRYDQALTVARQIQSQYPQSAQGHIYEGQIHAARKNFSEASQAYTQAFRLQPSGTILVQQLQVDLAMGTPETGEQRITSWLNKNPGDVTTRGALAESLIKRQQYKFAVEQYLTLDKLAPGNLVVLNNLTWALTELNDKRALAYADRACKLAPNDASVLDTCGWAHTRLGNPSQGLGLLKRALAKAPDSADTQWHIAYAYHATGDTARARQELKTLFDRRVPFSAEPQAKALYQKLISR
jgi:putative PEP-CTERM system TPR-repeat lipoprotein